MTTLVPVKMTEAELDALAFISYHLNAESRSQAIRLAIREIARLYGLQPGTEEQIREERKAARPRRSSANARLIGRRRREDPRHESA